MDKMFLNMSSLIVDVFSSSVALCDLTDDCAFECHDHECRLVIPFQAIRDLNISGVADHLGTVTKISSFVVVDNVRRHNFDVSGSPSSTV